MNNLEEKLVSNSSKMLNSRIPALDEMKYLLDSNAAEEKALLKSIGLGNSIQAAERVQADIIIRTKNKDELGKDIVHIKDIKHLCKKYRLYIKPAGEYMGTIPNELGAEMLRYVKEKSLTVSSSLDYSRFYMIAPPKMFKGYVPPHLVFTNAITTAQKAAQERIRARKEDPILVYKIPMSGGKDDYYAVIKSWGRDFTPLRRLYGALTTRVGVMWINFLSSLFIIFGLVKLAILQFNWLTNAKFSDGNATSGVFGCIIIFVIFLFWAFNACFKDFRKSIIHDITAINHPKQA